MSREQHPTTSPKNSTISQYIATIRKFMFYWAYHTTFPSFNNKFYSISNHASIRDKCLYTIKFTQIITFFSSHLPTWLKFHQLIRSQGAQHFYTLRHFIYSQFGQWIRINVPCHMIFTISIHNLQIIWDVKVF